MFRLAGSWSVTTRSTAPIGSASSASLVRTNVNGQTSPRMSSSSPGDDEVGGEAEGDELAMGGAARGEGTRRGGRRELQRLAIPHPVAVGYPHRGSAGPHQVQHRPHVHTST